MYFSPIVCLFTLSEGEKYVDFCQNSVYILKTTFLYVEALLAVGGDFKN